MNAAQSQRLSGWDAFITFSLLFHCSPNPDFRQLRQVVDDVLVHASCLMLT
ncbi:hypothetical protein [Xenorhabdus hominickii]|uniref:Uncharacterized protein n=1 Tax=Xenorhabdus hominickii TaxID=351679 RepID=A0A2G0Q2T0_XENHO|nr:hypothetical protein [Xenorhabdus hominickii]PHM53533.1 hypothetical protein Xhom_03531 [Xenorhabdus hominickii]